jgi:hypothetical protein
MYHAAQKRAGWPRGFVFGENPARLLDRSDVV